MLVLSVLDGMLGAPRMLDVLLESAIVLTAAVGIGLFVPPIVSAS